MIVISENPITGGGLGTASRNLSVVIQERNLIGGPGRGGHNFYLDWVAETGIIGAGALTVLIAMTFRNLLLVRKRAEESSDVEMGVYSRALLIIIPGMLVVYMFSTAFKDIMYLMLFFSLSQIMLRLLASPKTTS